MKCLKSDDGFWSLCSELCEAEPEEAKAAKRSKSKNHESECEAGTNTSGLSIVDLTATAGQDASSTSPSNVKIQNDGTQRLLPDTLKEANFQVPASQGQQGHSSDYATLMDIFHCWVGRCLWSTSRYQAWYGSSHWSYSVKITQGDIRPSVCWCWLL